MPRNPDGWGRRPHKWRGRWRAYLTLGYDQNGKPMRHYVYGKTEGECAQKLVAAREQHAAGRQPADRSLTVKAYLEDWFASKADEVSERTLAIYRSELQHALPHLGRVKLAELSPLHIERMMRAVNGKVVQFGKNPKRTLTARAANKSREILGNALSDAVRLGILPSNPVQRTRPLRHKEGEIRVWTAEQVSAFLEVCRGTKKPAPYYALFYTALTTGLRVGELLALEWRDLDARTLSVRRSAGSDGTKTAAGQRTLPLPSDTRQVLQAHRQGLANDGLDGELVFPTSRGGMATRQIVRKSLHAWSKRAGVPKLRPHDLRHTYASMMIANGCNPAELARLLGHTNAAFTLREYVHFFERAEKRDAPTLGDLTGARGGNLGGTASEPESAASLPN